MNRRNTKNENRFIISNIKGGINMRSKLILFFMAFAVLFVSSLTLNARVTEIQILTKESPAFGGASFGTVGQYEKLTGIMKCEVDPNDPSNSFIVNIYKAPTNARGQVEYDVDFVIYKPADMSKSNGKILYDTPNRGGMITIRTFNNTTATDPVGNGFLMKEGYTIVSNGWQAPYPIGGVMSFFVGLGSRLPASPGALMARLPVAKNADGSSIVAMSREEYYDPPFNTPGAGGVFTKYLTYPAATLDKSQAVLTARAHEKAEKIVITDWQFVDEYRFTFTKPAYADPGYIYEFIYPAKDPIVYGLAFASIRDVVSFLRYKSKDDAGNLNPLYTLGHKNKPVNAIKKALAFGMSQTGRVVKTFVYEGFNEDEKGRIVFDGINSHVGASRKVWINGEFSHPGDIFGNDQFPFTYARTRDQFTGEVDSNLELCSSCRNCPKIIHSDTESEIWSSGGSLVVTNTKGTRDLRLPDNVKAYMFTGAIHGSGTGVIAAPGATAQQMASPLDYRPLQRALLKALDKWVSYGIEPPESIYPNLSKHTLVKPENLEFPKIPAFSYTIGTTTYNFPAVNYNALYLGAYWINYSVQPPAILGQYPVYVMKVNKDGNGIDGIRLPDIRVPIGTYTGWNRTKAGFGGDNRLVTASGSFIPFAKTKAERLANGDPRLSLEERYPSHDYYIEKVKRAVNKLVHQRFLLNEDAQAIIDAAAATNIGN
jgi:hypothetical protein